MKRSKPSQVDLKRLRTVLEVARTESITTAAQTLGLTQSAVSRMVAELEVSLGQRLFDRLPRGTQPTEAGRRLVAGATRVLADIDDLVSEVANAPNRVVGRLRLGLAPSGYYATRTLISFVRQYPDVALETAHASEQTLCPRLLNGELDLVLGSSGYLTRWRDIDVSRLATLRFACMLRKDHPLSRIAKPTEADVLGYPLILPESVEPAHSDLALRYAHHALPALKPQYITNNLELIGYLVRSTDAFFPAFHPNDTFGGLDADFLMLRDVVQIPPHDLSFARVAHRPGSRVVEAFEKTLIDELRSA